MATSVRTVTRSDLERRREEILNRLGMTYPEFRDVVDSQTLTGEELDAAEELDQIAYLLGEEHADLVS